MRRKTRTFLCVFPFIAPAAYGQTAPASATGSDTKPRITQFVLYAERSIKIGEHSRAEDGDLGVRSAVAPKEGISQLTVGKHGNCRNLFAPSTTIGNDAKVRNVWTNLLNRDPDSEMGTLAKFPASDMPPLPLGLASGSGKDVTVAHDKHRSLTPGTYGAVTLAHNSTLTLGAGTYTFRSLRMDEDSRLLADNGGVDLRVVDGLRMGKEAKIAPRDDDAKANDFTVTVAGSDPTTVTKDTRLAPSTAVSIGTEAHVHALLAAPHGTVWMADEAGAKGAIAAFDIIVGERVKVELEGGFPVSSQGQQGSQQLHGYYGVPPNPSVATLVGPVAPSEVLNLSVGLPVRDPQGLQSFVNQVSDPSNPNYRHYLTLAQFTATYGASSSDYNAVVGWAGLHGLTVTATFPNNLLVDVSGTAAQVEEALYVNLNYRLRTDGSQFVATDRDPSLDLSVPILRVSGLDDFLLPRRAVGTAPSGVYWGWDLRNAYLGIGTACSALTGTGQTIGIYAPDNTFLQSDIDAYVTTAGAATAQNTAMAAITPTIVGHSSLGSGQSEVTGDIQAAHSMAPGAAIVVFEGNTGSTHHGDSILHRMATSSPPLTVASSSWVYGWNQSAEQAITEMAAQGVSFFQGSGDCGSAKCPPGTYTPFPPTDNRVFQNQTLVGGTLLTTGTPTLSPPPTSYPSPYYISEATWTGSGGGIMSATPQDCWPWPFCNSATTGIPGYQVGVDMSTNGGSTTFRNFPDVAILSLTMMSILNGSPSGFAGTSLSTPLWAGFMALANQQASINGVGNVGFANPLLYAIGMTRNQPLPNPYSLSFNDIADGVSTGAFSSVPGYDLATGWGTPTCGLITQVASPAPLNPQSFQLLQIHINNGDDGIRDDSTGLVAVYLSGALQPIILNEFHPPNSTGWDPKGAVHDLLFSFPAPVPANGVANISFMLPCCDDWSIGGLDVRLLNATGPEVCVFHGESTKNPDGSINTELGRLTHNHNPMASFNAGGCPTGSGAAPPPASPVSEVFFIFGTGDDDLRQGSELDVSFFKRGSTTPFETGILKPSGAPKFDNNTQNTVAYTLTTGSHPLSDFGSISISLSHSGNDEWHIWGLNVIADSPGGPQSCLYDAQGQSLQVLKSSAPSMTLIPNSGCP